ncbi:BQ5605_C002g01395 [Microbotryum silenes-dioicae]|uniref:BQ5605_C002g01395 protein n=1 Tax=Microbotryum silenes-dioicae TaxID=796604 RepID=A0A2X0MKK2_9BASI|nr:BQ5605_C002g01395 [Microbotryum silenes-dioicae]
MTVKHGHDCVGNALEVVPDAVLSRETNLSSALVSLVGKIDGKSLPQSPFTALAIIDGATAFARQRKAATDRAKHNEPKRGRLFLNAIIRHLEEIIAATARRIQVVVVFDHPILRPKLNQDTVLDRQDRQKLQEPSDKSTPVTHPIPFITNDTLAACIHGQSSKEWEVSFRHGDEPTRVATFVRWSEQGLLVVAAHEADPLVGVDQTATFSCFSAPTKPVVVPCYRARTETLAWWTLRCDAHPAVWKSRQRFVASLIFGCDYFGGITGIGPTGLRDLPGQWLDAATWQSGWDGAAGALIRNVDSEPAPTEKRIKEVKSLCDEIDPIQDLLHHYKDERFAKATTASITAVSQGYRVRFEGTPHEDPSKVSRYAYAPIRRNPPLVHQPGVSSTGPLPSLSSLSTVQDPEL